MGSELSAIQLIITQFGLPLAALILILWTGSRGDWVFGFHHRQTIADLNTALAKSEKREEEWKRLALRGTTLADNALTIATQQTLSRDGG